MNGKIAYCILTYNHPDVIQQVLSTVYGDYFSHNIDILIFDSSESDDTYKIVSKFMDQGKGGLFYISCKEIKSGDEKYLYVVRNMELLSQYEYIWPSKDRTMITGSNLDLVCEACSKQTDAILFCSDINRSQYIYPKCLESYDNPVELFKDYGALSTSWESVIFSTDMLKGIDWDIYIEKYNLGSNNNFNQPVILFSRLMEMESPVAKIVQANPYERMYSTLGSSMWINDTFLIFGKRWIRAINSLSPEYDIYKSKVIKDETMLPELFGSMDNLLYFYENHVLTNESFDIVRDRWEELSDIPVGYVEYLLKDDFDSLLPLIIREYYEAFSKGNLSKAAWYHRTNRWLSMVVGDDSYNKLSIGFDRYFDDINKAGYSNVFENVHRFEDAVIACNNF